jgi:hypothetical protein
MKHVTQSIVTVIAMGALATGCGSSGPAGTANPGFTVVADTTMTTGSLTKAQFVAQVNQICRRGWPIILGHFTESTIWHNRHSSRRERFARAVRLAFLAGLDFHIFDEIHRIKAPRGGKARVEEVIGKMQTAVERGQRELHAYSPGQLSAQFADYNEAARRYGLTACLVDGARVANAAPDSG